MQKTIFLQAALNGDSIHPAAPRTPAAIAEAARAAACASPAGFGIGRRDTLRIFLRPDDARRIIARLFVEL